MISLCSCWVPELVDWVLIWLQLTLSFSMKVIGTQPWIYRQWIGLIAWVRPRMLVLLTTFLLDEKLLLCLSFGDPMLAWLLMEHAVCFMSFSKCVKYHGHMQHLYDIGYLSGMPVRYTPKVWSWIKRWNVPKGKKKRTKKLPTKSALRFWLCSFLDNFIFFIYSQRSFVSVF